MSQDILCSLALITLTIAQILSHPLTYHQCKRMRTECRKLLDARRTVEGVQK